MILRAVKAWFDTIAPKVLPDTKLGDAVSYTLNPVGYLTRYTVMAQRQSTTTFLNAISEFFATGGKSWLFSDTVNGAKASAVIYSLMLTCRAYGVDPLTRLRRTP